MRFDISYLLNVFYYYAAVLIGSILRVLPVRPSVRLCVRVFNVDIFF